MVAGGCIISGAMIKSSLLFSDVRVDDSSYIEGAVLLPGVTIGRRCGLKRCIIDEGCVVPDGMQIGVDPAVDLKRFFVTKRGVVLVTQDMLRKLTSPT
jgi:glucose-1-phosphate adenylyltransferase